MSSRVCYSIAVGLYVKRAEWIGDASDFLANGYRSAQASTETIFFSASLIKMTAPHQKHLDALQRSKRLQCVPTPGGSTFFCCLCLVDRAYFARNNSTWYSYRGHLDIIPQQA